MIEIFTDEKFITYFIIPLLILVARVADVSIGTIRVFFISKGEKLISAFLGFFEVLIWLVAITRIMDNLNNVFAYLAYAGGFAIGTYLGVVLEKKIRIGKVMVRIFTNKDAKGLISKLRKKRYTFSCFGVESYKGKVNTLQTIINKKSIPKLINHALDYDPLSYYTIEEINVIKEYVPDSRNINYKKK